MATKTTSKKSTAKKTAGAKRTTKSASAKTTTRKRSTKSTTVEAPILRRAKSVSWMAIFECLVIAALGILSLIFSNQMFQIVFYIVGIFLIIKGVYKIVNYFAVHGKYDFYNNDLLYGVIALVFGILAIVFWEPLKDLVGIAVGAWMIYGALVRMNTAIKMRTAGVKEWFYALLLSLVMLALGVYVIIEAKAIVQIIGWFMIAAAGIGIVDEVIFIRRIDEVAR